MAAEDGTTVSSYREHRFDCDATGVRYFLDGELKHEDDRAPTLGGNLQVRVFAISLRHPLLPLGFPTCPPQHY